MIIESNTSFSRHIRSKDCNKIRACCELATTTRKKSFMYGMSAYYKQFLTIDA